MFGNPATTSILYRYKKTIALFLVLIFTGSMWFYLTDIGLRERRLHPSPDEVKDTHGDLFAPSVRRPRIIGQPPRSL